MLSLRLLVFIVRWQDPNTCVHTVLLGSLWEREVSVSLWAVLSLPSVFWTCLDPDTSVYFGCGFHVGILTSMFCFFLSCLSCFLLEHMSCVDVCLPCAPLSCVFCPSIHNNASSSEKCSGLNQERNLHRSSTVYKPKQSRTALNKCVCGFGCERQQGKQNIIKDFGLIF